MLALAPVCLGVKKVGLRPVVAGVGAASGLATMAVSESLRLSPYAYLACRIVQGFGLAVLFPLSVCILAKFGPGSVLELTGALDWGTLRWTP